MLVPLTSVIPSTLAGIQKILNFGINTFWFPVKVEGMTDERGTSADRGLLLLVLVLLLLYVFHLKALIIIIIIINNNNDYNDIFIYNEDNMHF